MFSVIKDRFKKSYKNFYPEPFDSGIQTQDVSEDSIVLIFDESEKKLNAINQSLRECQSKAKKFINYCSLTLTALVSFNSYILATYEHNSIVITIVSASFVGGISIFVAMINSFCVMGDSFEKAAEGREPRTALIPEIVKAVAKEEQYKFFLLNFSEGLQAAIDYNHKRLIERTSQLQTSYHFLRIVFVSYVSFISSVCLMCLLLLTDLAAILVAAFLVH